MNRTCRTFFLFLLIAFLLLLPAYSPANENRILIGLIPEINIFKQKQRFVPLGEYLSNKIGVDVRFTILSRYGDLLNDFEKQKLDGAFFGSFAGAAAIQKFGVVPLARPVDLDNMSTYQGYIFVRKDSGIIDVKGMKGKQFVFVEKATTAGYIFPVAYLRDHGISSPDGYFQDYYFAGSHDAAIDAVLRKKAHAGAAKSTVYDSVGRKNPAVEKELNVIARSPAVPSNGLCVRKDLDMSLKKKIQEVLLAMHNDPEGQAVLRKTGALKFIETSVKDYEPVYALALKAGYDLKKSRGRFVTNDIADSREMMAGGSLRAK